MSGLMMVFLLIAIIYAKNNQKQVVEWVNIEEEIYQALVAEFKDDLSDWQAEIERDTLTIRFMSRKCCLHEARMSFKTGSSQFLMTSFQDTFDCLRHDFQRIFPRSA